MKKSLLTLCYRIAKSALKKHDKDTRYKHCTFVIQDNTLIEWGTNRCVDSPLPGYADYQALHSEVLAMKRAKGVLDHNKGFEVINIRFNKSGFLKISKPCDVCYGYLKWCGCDKIYYTTNKGVFEVID